MMLPSYYLLLLLLHPKEARGKQNIHALVNPRYYDDAALEAEHVRAFANVLLSFYHCNLMVFENRGGGRRSVFSKQRCVANIEITNIKACEEDLLLQHLRRKSPRRREKGRGGHHHATTTTTIEMIDVVVSTPFLPIIAGASAHAVTDFGRGWWILLPYALSFFFTYFNSYGVTLFFLLASWLHFSRDVGGIMSLRLHFTFLVLTALRRESLAWFIFALYFCGLHAPLHMWRKRDDLDGLSMPIIYSLAGILFLLSKNLSSFIVTDNMQKIIVAHVAVDELERIIRASS